MAVVVAVMAMMAMMAVVMGGRRDGGRCDGDGGEEGGDTGSVDLAHGGVSFLCVAVRREAAFTVGAIHNLSKRTSFFGGYQHVYLDNPNAAAANDLSNAANAVSYTAPSYAPAGSNRSTFTIGLRHNF